ncbi:uncharacterized protein FOMMEDRAFT_25480 [Fomitiporia mediterranea MF3/22]|uniref:uncharacterized protein n=1 Tax=Fomitiporia mediterranea (strain MF3/22) TaxID=694068 RepID=UPI00044099DD|nr:uncharacterized protein FOMMEDRAFT_25480 [Fomitiporia mediterranea MF3/22]EJD08396.1 hypothetical protein FOMMEDRAFT_25480 [Fomitiporia mediterranea MF3/22]
MALVQNLRFARVRAIALSYTAAISVLTFAIGMFVLPTAGNSYTPALSIISCASIVTGLAASCALFLPRLKPRKRQNPFERRRIYVGAEAIFCVACLPLLLTALSLEAELASPQDSSAVSNLSSNAKQAFNRNGGRTLAGLLLLFSGSTLLVALIYTCIIIGLAVYTHLRTKQTNIWFADAAAHAPAFTFPKFLRFLQVQEDESSTETDMERARRLPRLQLEQLEADPGVIALARQVQARHRTVHTLATDCNCGEKLPWAPAHPDEYRALSRVYARVWTLVAEQEAIQRAERAQRLSRGLSQRQEISVPVPIFRVPTERERRRTVYIVSFDAVSAR